MLDNGRCWLLAVDFDKQSWVDDVGAFVETCLSVKLSVAVERSRSGNGPGTRTGRIGQSTRARRHVEFRQTPERKR